MCLRVRFLLLLCCVVLSCLYAIVLFVYVRVLFFVVVRVVACCAVCCCCLLFDVALVRYCFVCLRLFDLVLFFSGSLFLVIFVFAGSCAVIALMVFVLF